MFFRLILTGAVIYFGYQFVKGLLPSSEKKQEVKGEPQNKPLDLRDADVADAHYEDIDEKE